MTTTRDDIAKALQAQKDELQPVFDRICNPKDWRAPIHATIPETEFLQAWRAVQFFTATELKMVRRIQTYPSVPAILEVVADGYRRGPAGDH